MMGAGKSATGADLAGRLGREFVDLDAELERTAGRRIREIFAEEGEAAFRARERAAIASWAGKPLVVALGGGAIAQAGMPQWLAQTGTVVYLRANLDTLLERIDNAGERPLLAGLDREAREARLRALLREREPAYASAALAVDTDGRTASEVAGTIADALAAGAGR